jgi:hypothetical protein
MFSVPPSPCTQRGQVTSQQEQNQLEEQSPRVIGDSTLYKADSLKPSEDLCSELA